MFYRLASSRCISATRNGRNYCGSSGPGRLFPHDSSTGWVNKPTNYSVKERLAERYPAKNQRKTARQTKLHSRFVEMNKAIADNQPNIHKTDDLLKEFQIFPKRCPNTNVLHREGYGRHIYFNSQSNGNVLDLELALHFKAAIQAIEWEHKIARLIIIRSKTDHFIPGPDLKKLYCTSKAGLSYPNEFFKAQYDLVWTAATTAGPTLAYIDGTAMGAGGAILANCMMTGVTPNTVFAAPEVAYGFFPDCGMFWRLAQIPHKIGRYLALSGDRVSGSNLCHLGLAYWYMGEDDEDAIDFIMSNRPTDSLGRNLLRLRDIADDWEPFVLEDQVQIIERCFSHNTVESIMSALKNEKTHWPRQVAARMERNCPLSMKIALRGMQYGEDMDGLAQCLSLDYRIASRLVKMPDFYEGIEAKLMQKRAPEWKLKLSDIDNDMVTSFFAPFENRDQEYMVALERLTRNKQTVDCINEMLPLLTELTNYPEADLSDDGILDAHEELEDFRFHAHSGSHETPDLQFMEFMGAFPTDERC